MSDHERKIPFKDYVEEIAGADGLAVHERVMDWRHGHVAHRKRPEFESVETVVTYVNGSDAPSALHPVLGIDLGPEDEGEFVTSFRQLVEVLRTSLYERRILPLVMKIVDDLNAGTIPFPLALARRRSVKSRALCLQSSSGGCERYSAPSGLSQVSVSFRRSVTAPATAIASGARRSGNACTTDPSAAGLTRWPVSRERATGQSVQGNATRDELTWG